MLAIFFSPEESNHCPQKFKVWQLFKEFKLDLLPPIQELAQHRSFIEIEERSKKGDLKERGREKGRWGLGEEEGASEKGRKSSSCSPTPTGPRRMPSYGIPRTTDFQGPELGWPGAPSPPSSPHPHLCQPCLRPQPTQDLNLQMGLQKPRVPPERPSKASQDSV